MINAIEEIKDKQTWKALCGNKKYKFKKYYKFIFTFVAEDRTEVHVGGFSDSIYRAHIEADKEYTIEDLWKEGLLNDEVLILNERD